MNGALVPSTDPAHTHPPAGTAPAPPRAATRCLHPCKCPQRSSCSCNTQSQALYSMEKNCEQTTLCRQNKLWCLIAIYVLMCRLFAATFVGFGVVWGFFNDKFQHLEDRVALPSTAHTLESSCRLSQQGRGLVVHRVSQQTQGQGRKLLRISHHSV